MKLRRVFLKYCLRYFVGFLVILMCCLLLAHVAYTSIEKLVVEENHLKMQDGIRTMEQNISKMDLISQIIRQDSYFSELSQLNTVLLPREHLTLKYASQQLSNIGFIYTFSPFIFSVYRDNDLLISSSQCSDNYSAFYGQFLVVQDPAFDSAASFKTHLFEHTGPGIGFMRVESVQYYARGQQHTVNQAIMCVARDNTRLSAQSAYATVFVLRPEDLVRETLAQGNMENGLMQIVNKRDGNILLEYTGSDAAFDHDAEGYHFLRYDVPDIDWLVTVGFPRTVVDDQCKNVRMLLVLYIGMGLLLVLSLTLYFSYRQYSGVKHLFTRMPISDWSLGKGQNEYDALGGLLSDISKNRTEYERQIKALSQQNQAILLENLIVRGINTQEERKQFLKIFPCPLDFFCVVLLKMNTGHLEELQRAVICVVEYLKETCPHGFANVHSGTGDELFLLSLRPDDASDLQNIRQLFERVILILTEDMNLTFNVGISAIGTDIANISTCYNQARQVTQAYSQATASSVRVYRTDAGALRENVVGMEFLDKLYNLLICAESEAVRVLLNQFCGRYQKMPLLFEMQKQQVFFSIRNVFCSAHLHLALEKTEIQNLPVYKAEHTLETITALFLQAAESFCACVEANKKSRNDALKQCILQYMQENFATPSLTAGSVCYEIGIAEKYLCQFIKEQTGETFSSYLERLRMQAAMHYLTTTDMSNEKIAASTGFAAVNTFYRVFSKRTGVSPGTYRSNHMPSRTP